MPSDGPNQHSFLDPDSIAGAGKHIDPGDPALLEIMQALVDLQSRLDDAEPAEDTVKMAIRLGRARLARMQAGTSPMRGSSARESVTGVVYYVRRAAMVKIGTTVNLRSRMTALLPEEILAIEPGSHSLEAAMHQRFVEYRVPGQREWFYASAALQAHVTEVRRLHGDPPADLPTLQPGGGMLER